MHDAARREDSVATRDEREWGREDGYAALVAAVQRGDERAAARLYEQCTPILRREAARLGVDGAERAELVADALRGVVLALLREGSTAPRSLLGYAIVALRHALQNRERQARRIAALERALRQEQLMHAATEQPADSFVEQAPTLSVVPAPQASSDAAIVREAFVAPSPPDTDRSETSSRRAHVLGALTERIRARVSAEEWQLLTWLGDYAPQRDIGRWLGISHGAVRVRVHRLRERLRACAREFGDTLPPDERRELDRFFRRAGVFPPSTPTRRAVRGRSATDAETP